MIRIRWTQLATEQVRKIREHRWQLRLRNRVRLLARFPQSGRVVPELEREDVREVVVGVFRVAYLVTHDEIIIQSVFDSRSAFPWPGEVGEARIAYQVSA